MKRIKKIFDEIANEGGSNKKMEILKQYENDELLKEVLYLANSPRMKYYIKKIPDYIKFSEKNYFTNSVTSLKDGIEIVKALARRDYTGNEAIGELSNVLSSIPDDDAYIIERIIEKDCKIGMGTSNINKIFKGLIEKTPYMGASPYSPKLVSKLFESNGDDIKVIRSDVKMDGRYMNAIIRNGEVEAVSRQGEATILTGAKFMEELSTFEDCVLNGELTMKSINRYESNGIVSSLIDIFSKKNSRTPTENAKKIANFEKKHMSIDNALSSIVFTVWDVITVDEYYDNASSRTCKDRFRELIRIIETYKPKMVELIEHQFVRSPEEAFKHFQSLLERNLEGTILKSLDGAWKDGKPNWQIKLKKEILLDLKIVGFNYGTGKNISLISSLNVESSDGLLKTSPTGISEMEMKFITTNQSELLGTIVEVKCSGLSQDSEGNYSLLHPVYIRSRVGEKISANTLKECIEIDNAVLLL